MADTRFSFGKNWSDYVDEALNPERIDIAITALKDLLMVEDLHDQTFVDIGSGSGLHSLAALRLGAKQIISFDYDADSVATTARLREQAGSPANWEVLQGSILDEALVERYRGSVVYSWGVLHHTGAMWQAIRNAARMVEPGGLFCIAIYNRMDRWRGGGSSQTWQKIKRYYVNSPAWRKRMMIWGYKLHFHLYNLLWLRKNSFAMIREQNARGMNWHHDVVDWVGGYPFEFASVEEVTSFCENEFHMTTLKVHPQWGHACNEFLFRAPG
jgi:SAM-dependent methyltransferase